MNLHPVVDKALRLCDVLGADSCPDLCDALNAADLYSPTAEQVDALDDAMNAAIQTSTLTR